jgi:hypothetical protein
MTLTHLAYIKPIHKPFDYDVLNLNHAKDRLRVTRSAAHFVLVEGRQELQNIEDFLVTRN